MGFVCREQGRGYKFGSAYAGPMTVVGQTETRAHQRGTSVLPPGADMKLSVPLERLAA
jgi:hypothetical protein